MTPPQHGQQREFVEQGLDAEWQEVLQEAKGKPWLLRLLARHGVDIVTRYALWKQRLARLRTGERRRLRQRLGVGIGGAALILALAAMPGLGAPNGAMTVTNGTGTIANGDGCSLPEAIINANNDDQSGSTDCAAGTAGLDTITLATDVTLTTAHNTTYGPTGLPVVGSAITIEGNGHTISRSAATDFRILQVAWPGDLTLNSATVSGGIASGNFPANSGGGIFAYYASVAVTNSTLSGNSASYNGGGIYALFASVTVSNSTLSGNSADTGGGIYAHSATTVAVTNSTLSGNSASYNGGGIFVNFATVTVSNSTLSGNSASYGGGIFAQFASVTVTNSTLSGNTASGAFAGGGGIQTYSSSVTLQNSTLSGNSANYGGGGIQTYSSSVMLQNSTLSGNSASLGGGIQTYNSSVTLQNSTLSGNSASSGGGIYRSGGAVTALNSIVALQSAGVDCSTALTSGGYNIDSDSSCGFTGTGDQQNVSSGNLNLGALGSNGGPTQTRALGAGSFAIDKIPNGVNGCVAGTSTDQRGAVRADGVGRGGTGCDVGAYEYDSAETPNAIDLRAFTAASGSDGGLAGLAAGALAMLGLGAVFVRRRKNAGSARATGRSPQAPADSAPELAKSAYQPPAIIYRGQLELRAGSPLALPDFMDPDKPFP